MELKYRAAQGIAWSALQRGGNQVLSFLVFLVLSRLLEPKDFGLFALASIFTSFVQIFVDQGFSIAIVQFPKIEREHLDTAFWTALLVGAFLTAIGIASAKFVASFFHEPRLASIVVWLSLSLILISLSTTQQARLLRELEFKKLATRTLFSTLIGGTVGIISALAGLGVYSLVIKTLVIHFIGVLVLWNVSDWRPGFRFSLRRFKALFDFGTNITANNILVFLSQRMDNFLIGHYMGASALGYYSIAYNFIQMLVNIFVTTTTSVTISAFSRLNEDREQMLLGFYKATRYSSLFAFPAFIVVSILSPLLVEIFFGEKWLPSVPVMQVLSLIGLIYPISIFNTQVLVAAGKPSWRLRIMMIYAIVDVIAFLIAVRWGIAAVAGALVMRMYLLSPLSYYAVHRVIRIDPGAYIRQFIPSLVGTFALAITILGLLPVFTSVAYPPLRLFLLAFSGGIVYLLVIQLMAPQISDELIGFIRLSLPWARKT